MLGGIKISCRLQLGIFSYLILHVGARGGVVDKALGYKLTGRGFDSRWCQWSFSVT